MSGYVPRHSRKKGEPQQSEAQDAERASLLDEFLTTKQEETIGQKDSLLPSLEGSFTSATPKNDEVLQEQLETESLFDKAPATVPSKPQLPELEDSLASAILDADKAVQEHPELTNPLIVIEGNSEVKDAEALEKIQRRRWPVVIAIILAVIVISGAVTYYVLSSQAHEREASRQAGYDALDEAIALIQESDQVVVAIDEATVAEVTEADIADRQALIDRLPTTLETLNTAEEFARSAVDLMNTDEDRAFAQHVIDSAVNRKDLLQSGRAIITQDIAAMKATLIFGSAWELIIKSDTELRATTELSRSSNIASLQEAIERNQVILSDLDMALSLLTQAKEAFNEADFSTVEAYIARKRESVVLAIEADQAVLNGDIGTVNTKNTEFSLKDAEVVEAANAIPANPLVLITDAYEKSTEADRKVYESSRANAADADGYIREYVGVETQTAVQ